MIDTETDMEFIVDVVLLRIKYHTEGRLTWEDLVGRCADIR